MKKLLGILVLGSLPYSNNFADTEKIKLVCLFDEDLTESVIVNIDGKMIKVITSKEGLRKLFK